MTDYTGLLAELAQEAAARWYQSFPARAKDAIESLQRDLAERDATIAELRGFLVTESKAREGREALLRENDALRARAEAAEKDAARYRWLRKDGDTTAGLMSDTYADWDPFDESWPDVLDTAIDAAIAAGGDDAKD